MEIINSNLIVKNNLVYKDLDASKKINLLNSIRKYGQLRPLLVCNSGSGRYKIVKGNTIFDCLIELNIINIYCVNLGDISDLEIFAIKSYMDESIQDVNILTQAMYVDKLFKKYQAKDIAENTPYDYQDIERFKELIKFENIIFKKEVVLQHSIFNL